MKCRRIQRGTYVFIELRIELSDCLIIAKGSWSQDTRCFMGGCVTFCDTHASHLLQVFRSAYYIIPLRSAFYTRSRQNLSFIQGGTTRTKSNRRGWRQSRLDVLLNWWLKKCLYNGRINLIQKSCLVVINRSKNFIALHCSVGWTNWIREGESARHLGVVYQWCFVYSSSCLISGDKKSCPRDAGRTRPHLRSG
jgi:hypothetical protein